ncbi:hypothetical protein BJV82DRAFT_282197 [Fennellomyces sp. T-0311]|nr:hypothetical protein BJV82DRAFT_282197 [Fennellomyces sp. T-0311]
MTLLFICYLCRHWMMLSRRDSNALTCASLLITLGVSIVAAPDALAPPGYDLFPNVNTGASVHFFVKEEKSGRAAGSQSYVCAQLCTCVYLFHMSIAAPILLYALSGAFGFLESLEGYIKVYIRWV